MQRCPRWRLGVSRGAASCKAGAGSDGKKRSFSSSSVPLGQELQEFSVLASRARMSRQLRHCGGDSGAPLLYRLPESRPLAGSPIPGGPGQSAFRATPSRRRWAALQLMLTCERSCRWSRHPLVSPGTRIRSACPKPRTQACERLQVKTGSLVAPSRDNWQLKILAAS